METKELQKKGNEIIDAIDLKMGVVHDADRTFIHILEEFGELARQQNNLKIRKIAQDKGFNVFV